MNISKSNAECNETCDLLMAHATATENLHYLPYEMDFKV